MSNIESFRLIGNLLILPFVFKGALRLMIVMLTAYLDWKAEYRAKGKIP